MKTILLIFFLPLSIYAQSIIRPFINDKCTGYKTGTKKDHNAWEKCCLIHDLDFWAGGPIKHRDKSDLELKNCVTKTNHPYHAKIMWIGVKLGKISPIKIKGKQWGNAWSDNTRNTNLNLYEIDLLNESLLLNSNIDSVIRNVFIEKLIKQYDQSNQ